MTSFRKAIRFFSLALSLGLPIAASAATFDVKTLIDTDNKRSTGCNVMTPLGIVSGIDVIVTTQGTVNGSTGTVTAVTRQTCTNAVLNQFSSPTAVDGGWNVGVSSIGDVTVESHMGLDVLTWDNIGTPRFVFVSTSGLEADVLLTPWSWGGGDIIMPHAARDRAMTPIHQRNILLDGGSSDWVGSVPLANGTDAPPVWRFITASAYAGMHDLFFNFKIHTNGAAPTAHDDHYSLSTLGGTLTVATLGVLNNDNPNNQPITASLVDTTQHGTLALAPDGGFTYIHDGSLASQDQFHYVDVGTSLSSNLATVTIDLPGTHPYTFTSANATTFTAGQFNTFQVTVTGKPTPALTEDGVLPLPSGVTFVDNGNGTGTLSGTPAANTVGIYHIVFNAEKNNPHGSSQDFTLTVTCPGVTSTITPTPPQVCANSAGNTAAGPAGMTTYTWSITNGTITSAANIQTITYTAGPSGVVGLTLTVADASNCSATATLNVTINSTPTATITPAPLQVCANSPGNTASGPAGMTTYAWSIVNGTITSATNIQTITYTAGASGSVGLTLTVTNGCSSPSNTVNVPINANPTTPAITPTPSSVCPNSTGNTASGPAGATSYAWSITNGTITSATNTQTITYTAGASGTVGLTLVVTNAAGCSASNTANVPINPAPATPTITPTPAQVCANSTGNSAAGPAGATTYTWSIVNGTITSATNIQTITYSAGASGTVGLTLTVTNASGCSATNTSNVTINANPAPPTITTPASVCANSTGNSASGPAATTWAWSIVNGTITSATNIQTITYTAGVSGTVGLTLTVTNASGCSATNSGNVTINANPSAPTITPSPTSVCASSTGNTAAGPAGATTYAWSIVNGTITSATNIQTITYSAGASGTVDLTLTVTNASGCSASNTANVTINANPTTPTISPTPSSVCPNSGGNSASGPVGATSYAWSITNGAITSATNAQNITYTAGASGVVGLTLTVTNASGCSATNTVNVTINPAPATPTITTPAQVCANSTGNSADGPAGATSYAWSIVNGTITSATNIQTITYTAGASGTVDLTLVVTNGSGCPATNTVNVTINANPTPPTISPSPASVCANSTGNTAAGPAGATSYAWSIVNGTITSATNIQTITYTAGASGTVDLTLVVTNPAGCSASNTTNVTINPNPATPTITPTPSSVCANSTGNTAAGPAGATSYAWSSVNGTITSATNIQTITYTAGASGTVDLTLVVTNPSGCSASNTANVTINPSPATPPIISLPVQVCANSTGNTASGPAGATSYAWSIVNGTITSATNIQTITYTAGASGTVDLTLVVTNASGCSASNTSNVTINANPTTPAITTPAQVCANSTGNTASGPAGATSYAWSIVNGTITSATNIQTITYTAGASGTVGLTLVVTNPSGCSASNTNNVTINANPATPTITPSPAQVCANSTGNTAAGPAGATSYAWSIVNGTITSATNIQTITYTAGASGTVDLTLVVTNPSGCSASNTNNVIINANPATPSITTPASVCANSTGNSASGPAGATSYAWSIVNGTITSATNIQTITYTAGASGTVGLTLVVTNPSGCSASNTNNVTINANPATPTITTPANVCANSTGNSASGPAGATSYAWSIVNGTITSATNIQTITYTAGASGTVDLTLVVTNPSGCSASNTNNVTINANPATPTITTPANVCANSTGNSASGPAGATSYAWSIVNGTITSATNIQTITYTAGASGTVGLTLVVTNPSGCSASNTNNVTINANPVTPAITVGSTVCANSTGNTASGPAGATTYAWSITNGTITSATNIQNIIWTAGLAGTTTLSLTVTNASGCATSNNANVTVNPNPAPSITAPAAVCANSTGNTAAGPAGVTTYAWSIANGTITSATNIQTITWTAGASGPVTLNLTVTNASGCIASNSAIVTVNANPATPTITPTPVQVCANSTGNSAAGPAGATTYAWSIVNGTITSATNIQTITYTAGASGTVGLSLTVTNGSGCAASSNANVTINANPATPAITVVSTVCAFSTGNTASGPAGATTYAWSITNGTITSATNIQTITWSAGNVGTTTLSLTVTNVSGCAASNTADVTVSPSPTTPAITAPSLVCGSSTGNTASGPAGATTYSWSISGAGASITGGQTAQTVTFTAGSSAAITLTLTVTNASGCSASNNANVTVNPTITLAPSGANPNLLTGTFATAYSQNFTTSGGTGPFTMTITPSTPPANLSFSVNTVLGVATLSGTPNNTGVFTFSVTTTDANGCSASENYSLSIAPKVVNDIYAASGGNAGNTDSVGNTQSVAAAFSTPTTPFVSYVNGVLANDQGPALTVTTASVTNAAGTITFNSSGAWSYVPAVNFTGTASFAFVVSSNSVTANSSISIAVSNRVWYVNNSGAAGNGQSQSPFNALAAAQTAAAANDIIFIHLGTTVTTPLSGGLSLQNGAKLWGEGFGLTVNGNLLVAAGTQPRIKNTAGAAVTVDTSAATAGNRQNVEIKGLDLESTTTNGVNVTSNAANITGITIAGNNVRGAGTQGINLNEGSTGAFAATITGTSITSVGNGIQGRTNTAGTMTITASANTITTSAGNGVDIRTLAGASALNIALDSEGVTAVGNGILIDGSAAGTTTITSFLSNSINGNTTGTGISITSATFDATPGNPFNVVSGGSTVIGASGNGVGAAGMVLTTVKGDLSFTDLDIFTSAGAGLSATSAAAFNSGTGTGFQIVVPGSAANIDATGGPAVSLSTVTGTLPFVTIKSATSPTTGVALNSFLGSFSAGSGSTISGTSGTGFQVGSSNATITYDGTINTTAGKGVDLTSNNGSTISFTGALTLSTGSNTAFNVTGAGPAATTGGTVSSTNTTSTITTTTGTALNVVNSTIGSGNLKFTSITAGTAASGPTNGIVLNNTGASGGLIVSGTGSAGSGGTIQKTGTTGISLTSVGGSVSLTNMVVKTSTHDGIRGTTVHDFTLASCSVTSNGTVSADNGVHITDASGTVSMTSDSVTSSFGDNVDFDSTVSSAAVITTFTVTGGAYSSSTNGAGFLVQLKNNAVIQTGSLTGMTLNANATYAIDLVTNDNSTIGNGAGAPATGTFTMSGNTITNDGGVGVSFANGGGSGSANMYVRFVSNTMTFTKSHAINIVSGAGTTGGTQKVLIDSNIIGTSGSPDSGSKLGEGIQVTQQGLTIGTVTITNNTIRALDNGAGEFGNRGIDVQTLGPSPANGSGPVPFDVKIFGNNVDAQYAGSFPQVAIYLGVDHQSSTTTLMHAEVHGNTVPVGPGCEGNSCSGTTGMIFYDRVLSPSTGTLFNFSGSGANVSSELANTNTGMAGKTGAVDLVNLTLTATPVNVVP